MMSNHHGEPLQEQLERPSSAESHAHPLSVWWHEVTTPLRGPLACDRSVDVVVVGLGGSGLAAVRAARARGATVVGIDAGRIAGAAAGRNGGLLLGGMAEFYHDVVARVGQPRALALYESTLQAMAAMRRDTPHCCWWNGSLRVAETEAEWADCEHLYAAMHADGLPVAWYNGAEGRGLLFPADGACNPVQRVHALATLAEDEGAELFEHTHAESVASGVVHTSGGHRVQAPLIVVCVDGALGRVLPQLASELREVRLQMLATAPATDVRIDRPVYARDGYDYWQQLPNGRVVLGGGRDFFEQAEYSGSDQPTAEVQAWMERRIRKRVHTTAKITHRWAATVTYTADYLPIARSIDDGLWAVGGYSGTGNVVGALCAEGAVARGLGEESEFLTTLDGGAASGAS